jgi:ATP-binding cassette subfamily F protein 3
MTQLEVRSLLASVGFVGEDVFLPASGLSGGELARLHLARISLERPNLLILDEPTNHLDIYTRDTVCEALKGYAGTMLVVTHDRYLMEALCCRMLLLSDGRGSFFESYGSYRDGMEEQRQDKPAPAGAGCAPKVSLPERGERASSQKDQRRERARERERRLSLESRIEELEGDVSYLEAELARPDNVSDHQRLAELCGMLESAREELAKLSDEWLQNYAE